MKLLTMLVGLFFVSACASHPQRYTGIGDARETALKIHKGHYIDKYGQLKPFYLPN